MQRLCAQDIDRFSPAWWFPDVPARALVPLTRPTRIRLYLRQARRARLWRMLRADDAAQM